MDWLWNFGEFWLTTLAWLAGFGVVFGLLTRLMPCNPGMAWWKNPRGTATDLVYWLIVPLFLRVVRTVMLVLGVALLFGGRDPQPLPVGGWPLWLQCLAILVLQDVMLYVIHRAFHTRLAWRFHAVHHSPTELDWTATARFHPVNNLLAFSLADVAVLLLGFKPEALVLLAPFNIVYSAMVHANLNWTFGPLRYVFASPVFHRWHHTTREEGLDKNFASTFPVLDLLGGTFYMPAGRLPDAFGTGEAHFPETFWGQFVYPWQSAPGVTRAWRKWVRVAAPVAVLACVGIYGYAFLAERNEKLANEANQIRVRQWRAEASRHAAQLDLARQACRDNDIARATTLLDASFPESEEQEYVRDLCRARCLLVAGKGGPILGVALSADGRRIVTGDHEGRVTVYDAASGREEMTHRGHVGPVSCVAIAPDGRRIASGGHDGTAQAWDVAARHLVNSHEHPAAVLAVALRADGQRVVSADAVSNVEIWDAANGQRRTAHRGQEGAIAAVALSGDGQRLVSCQRTTAVVHDEATMQDAMPLEGHADLVSCVGITPDGLRVVTGSHDQSVRAWDLATWQTLVLRGHTGAVTAVAVSGDGTRIVSGGKDRVVRVWDALTGRASLALRGHTGAISGVGISADGRRIVSASLDGTLAIWDVAACVADDRPR